MWLALGKDLAAKVDRPDPANEDGSQQKLEDSSEDERAVNSTRESVEDGSESWEEDVHDEEDHGATWGHNLDFFSAAHFY